MVHELPLLPKQRLLAASDPIAAPRSDAPLRTLRRKEALSRGLDLRLRGEGGQLAGSLQVYCSLNRDAIRLARLQEWPAAIRLAQAASQIETSAACIRLKTLIEAVPSDGRDAWQHYVRAMHSDAVRECAVEVAKSIETARGGIEALGRHRDSFSGYIIDVSPTVVEVESPSKDRVKVPRASLRDAAWDVLGAPVSVFLEQHGHHVLYEIEPGLSEQSVDVGDDIDPFDYEWPASEALTARIEELLSGPGTVPLGSRETAAA
jgi:hypothetical protein